MKVKTIAATIALAAVPFFATAAAQHGDQNASQATVEQTAPGMMGEHAMEHSMMNTIDRVKNDLASLANENDPAVLHKRIAQDQSLLEQFYSHMSGMMGMRGSMMSGGHMMSGGMMSRNMSDCLGAAQQPQK